MLSEEFKDLVRYQFTRCRKVLTQREQIYGDNYDRLIQFKQAGQLMDIPPIQALAGMLSKHTTHLYDMLFDPNERPKEEWEEVITDHINYLVLLRALLEDEGMIDER